MSSSSSSSATSVSYSRPLVNPVPIGSKYNLGMQIINTANPPLNGDDVDSAKRKASMKMCVAPSLLIWHRCSSAHIQILVFKTLYILTTHFYRQSSPISSHIQILVFKTLYILRTPFYRQSSPNSSHCSFAWYIRRLFSTRRATKPHRSQFKLGSLSQSI
jgi:hypothetical protein